MERRKAPRANVNFPVRWQRNRTRRSGNVVSLSRTGFFVLSGGRVKAKEVLRFNITLPDGEELTGDAEVVEAAFEIGFAVTFIALDKDNLKRLDRVLAESFGKTPKATR